jgi:hypothetical protein
VVLEQRPVQAAVRVPARAAVAQQRPSRRRAQSAPVASNPAAARRPCSDRQVVPAQQRRPEPVEAAAMPAQRSAQAEVAVEAQVWARAAVVPRPRS